MTEIEALTDKIILEQSQETVEVPGSLDFDSPDDSFILEGSPHHNLTLHDSVILMNHDSNQGKVPLHLRGPHDSQHL